MTMSLVCIKQPDKLNKIVAVNFRSRKSFQNLFLGAELGLSTAIHF